MLVPTVIFIICKMCIFVMISGLLDHVTVLIGIGVRGKAVAGVVYQPYYNYQAGPDATKGRAIWGILGVGTYAQI